MAAQGDSNKEDEKMNRRNFFRRMAGAAAAPIVASLPFVVAEANQLSQVAQEATSAVALSEQEIAEIGQRALIQFLESIR